MQHKLTAAIPYDTLLRYMQDHWADVAIALKPSTQQLATRMLTIRDSHQILAAKLSRHGIELLTDAKEVS